MTSPRDETLPSVETVDREIAGGFRSLLFSPDLERFHEEETQRDRVRYFITCGQIATVLYDLFLVCDWQMTPDVFKAALIVRLGIFTPLFFVTWFVISRRPAPWIREGISSALAIASVGLALSVLVLSRSPDLATYEYGSILVMVFTAVVQRLRFRYAAFTLACMFVIQVVAAFNLHGVTTRLVITLITFLVTAFVLLLWAAYSLEREQRRSYLFDLRSRILNDRLDRIAKQDALTGLWNRRYLEATMEAAWADAQAVPRPVSVILLDIDHFKLFNDSNGHIEGDRCLQDVASCIRTALPADDTSIAVRFGGEEFLVCIDGADTVSAKLIAERIQASIRVRAIPHPGLGGDRCVTASFGIATGLAPHITPEQLAAAADNALYGSKRAGRDRIRTVVVDGSQDSIVDDLMMPLAS